MSLLLGWVGVALAAEVSLPQDSALWTEEQVRAAMVHLGFAPLGCEEWPGDVCRYRDAEGRVVEVSRQNLGEGLRMGPLSSEGVDWFVEAPLEKERKALLQAIEAHEALCPLVPDGLTRIVREQGYPEVEPKGGAGAVVLVAVSETRQVEVWASCEARVREDDWRRPSVGESAHADGRLRIVVQDLGLVKEVQQGLLGLATQARPPEQDWVDWSGEELARRVKAQGWTIHPSSSHTTVFAEKGAKAARVQMSSGSGLPMPTHVYARAGSRTLSITVYDQELSQSLQFQMLDGVEDLCELRRTDMAEVLAAHELQLGRMERDSFPGCEFTMGTAAGDGVVVEIAQMCARYQEDAPYGCMPLGAPTPSALMVSVQDETAGRELLEGLLGSAAQK